MNAECVLLFDAMDEVVKGSHLGVDPADTCPLIGLAFRRPIRHYCGLSAYLRS